MTTTVIVMLATLALCGACFIRNCPPGGKRSVDLMARGTLPCLTCGPGNEGQCVGPKTCCGPFGCYMGTDETLVCLKENERTTACEIRGQSCGARAQGNCVAEGICCDSKACAMNDKCRTSGDDTSSAELLSLLNKILQGSDLE
ncbi:conopressin/neurophysin-like [Dreissena polymorpha]|uniref:Uncharacterized protein n=1 Tax=Dreissena polymorpha TaxID=45954 RepID=A0A9D3YXJ7_DREPO|nr:conopressin/neurophysin-like [Dreissena polymorpha]KAH3708142.1 hypothetical protein DPMN_067581 [Dreissena polymorpha]